MKQMQSSFVSLAALLANVAALHTLFVLFAFRQGGRLDWTGLALWWSILILTQGALSFFLRKARQQRSVLLLLLAGFLLQALLTWRVRGPYPTLVSSLCLAGMWGYSYLRCYELLSHPISVEQLMVVFETSVLMLLVTALFSSAGAAPVRAVLPTALGTLLSLAALARKRASSRRPAGHGAGRGVGAVLPAALLAVFGGLAALSALLLTNSAAALLTHVSRALVQLAGWGLAALGRMLTWLISLLPVAESGPILLPESTPGLAGQAEGPAASNGAILLVLVGAVLAVGAGYLLYLFCKGRGRISPHSPALSRRVVRTRRGFGALLALLLGRLYRWMGGQIRYCLRYNTPEGLLVWLDRRLRRKHRGRGRGETCRGFLARISRETPECAAELSVLADALDRLYFSDGAQAQSAAQVRAQRRRLRKALAQRPHTGRAVEK